MGVILLEMFSGIVISEGQLTLILGMVGITTTAGTSNAILKHRAEIKSIINDTLQETKSKSVKLDN